MNNVRSSTPWGREAIRQFVHQYPDEAASIDSAVPENHYVLIVATAGIRGRWTGILVREEGLHTTEVRRTLGPSFAAACWGVIREGIAA